MKTQEVKIKALKGLHARPVAEIVRVATTFQSEIVFSLEQEVANAKSLMSLLALGVKNGDHLLVTVHGEDEESALSAIISTLEALLL